MAILKNLTVPIAPKRTIERSGEKYVSLSALCRGEKAKIMQIDLAGPVKRRLLDMGLLAGTEVMMKTAAPLGDPVAIGVKGYDLSLRKGDAELIMVEVMR